jgi:hypothetical protein
MKCETLDMNFVGKNFRDYVHANDISLINRHFQEGKNKTQVKVTLFSTVTKLIFHIRRTQL